jgi:hypothetical protein
MFALLRVALRSFAIGVAVGILVAPRPGEQTRRMLMERASAAIDSILELAALPPMQPERAVTNGHSERPARRRSTPARDQNARSS